MSQPEVSFEVPYQERHSRLTTFFRYFMALLPLIWAGLIGIAAFFGTIVAWFALLFTGRYPAGIYRLNSEFARYSAKVNAYYYLATDRFPGWSAESPAGYPVALRIGEPLPAYDRMKVLFRIFLAIPPALISYAMNIVVSIGSILAWFVIVFTGKLPHGLYGIIRLGLSYQVRVVPYFLLLTETWPAFTQDSDADALREGDVHAGIPGPPPGTPPQIPGAGEGPPVDLPGGFEPPAPPPS